MIKRLFNYLICGALIMSLGINIMHANASSDIDASVSDVVSERNELLSTFNTIQKDSSIEIGSKLRQIVTLLFDAKRNQLENNLFTSFDFGVFWAENTPNDNIEYFIRSMELEKRTYAELKISLVNAKTELTFSDIILEDHSATVEVYEWFEYNYYTIEHGLEKMPSGIGIDYTIHFIFEEDGWKISDIDFHHCGTEVLRDSGISVDSVLTMRVESATTVQPSVILSKPLAKESLVTANAVVPTRSEYQRKFALYAANYGGTKRSTYFFDYSDYGGDCQNFGSQCVWYALGGVESSTAINGNQFPMISNTYSTRQWHASKIMSASNSWMRVPNFATYVSSGNYYSMGLYGTIYSGVANADVGDIIQISDGTSYYHTYVVNKVSGTAGSRTTSNIWVCSHTTDCTTTLLSTIAGSGTFRTVRVIGYIDSVS